MAETIPVQLPTPAPHGGHEPAEVTRMRVPLSRRLRIRGGARNDGRPAHPPVAPAPDPIPALASRVAGPVLTPGDPGYDEERAGHNLLIDDQPAVIVGATGAADVMAAVAFATGHGMPV